PYTVEAWCDPSDDDWDRVTILVNRTPVAAKVDIERDDKKAELIIFGCNLGYYFKVGRKPVRLYINVQIPHMPITSNGKEPNLGLFLDSIRKTVAKAAKRCQRANRVKEARTDTFLPAQKKGRPSDEDKAKYAKDLQRFADRLKEIDSTVDFKVSSRGWCYIL